MKVGPCLPSTSHSIMILICCQTSQWVFYNHSLSMVSCMITGLVLKVKWKHVTDVIQFYWHLQMSSSLTLCFSFAITFFSHFLLLILLRLVFLILHTNSAFLILLAVGFFPGFVLSLNVAMYYFVVMSFLWSPHMTWNFWLLWAYKEELNNFFNGQKLKWILHQSKNTYVGNVNIYAGII